MKKLISVIFLTVLFLSLSTTILAKIPEQSPSFYVNDFAEIFSEDEEKLLISKALSLKEKHDKVQIVISTVTSLDGITAAAYAPEMINKYGIGYDDMGILILFAPNEREIFVCTGLKMESYITDAKASKLLNEYAMNEIRNGNYSEGLIQLQEAFIQEIDLQITQKAEWDITKPKVITSISISLLILLCGITLRIYLAFKDRKIKTLEIENNNLRIELSNLSEVERKKRDFLSYNLNRKTEKLSAYISELNILKEKLSYLQDKYERACRIYPDLESEVKKDIEKEIKIKDLSLLVKVEELIQKALVLPLEKESVSQIDFALKQYSSLNKRQQGYSSEILKSNLSKLKRLYNDCLEKQYDYDTLLITSEITAVISAITIAKARHLDSLEKIQNKINSLSYNIEKRFDKELIKKVSSLLEQAKKDKQREEEEEERQRQARMNSDNYTSSSSNSSNFTGSNTNSFSGGGGSSGGGGAGSSW